MRCKRIHLPRRYDNEFCSSKCEHAAIRDDAMSMEQWRRSRPCNATVGEVEDLRAALAEAIRVLDCTSGIVWTSERKLVVRKLRRALYPTSTVRDD